LDFFGAGEVGDGGTDFEDPSVGAGAQANLLMAVSSSLPHLIQAINAYISGAHLGLASCFFLERCSLNHPRIIDPLLDEWAPMDRRRRGWRGPDSGSGRHFDLDVDAVEKRARRRGSDSVGSATAYKRIPFADR